MLDAVFLEAVEAAVLAVDFSGGLAGGRGGQGSLQEEKREIFFPAFSGGEAVKSLPLSEV